MNAPDRCPDCGFKSQVFDTRTVPRSGYIWRRRECIQCGHRFTTEERTRLSIEQIKEQGVREFLEQRGSIRIMAMHIAKMAATDGKRRST